MGVRYPRSNGHGHHQLHARMPHLDVENAKQFEARAEDMSGSGAGDALNRLMARTNNLDEKPVGNTMTLPIALGVCIPLVVALCVLVYLHRRSQARMRKEDEADKYKSMDFGLDENKPVKSKRRSAFLGMGKDPGHKTQLSMDMNLSSPYLLPPHLQNSRESMNSLAKTIHQQEDPYRSVASFMVNDATSQKGALSRDSSVTTTKTVSSGLGHPGMPPQKSMPTGPLPSLPPAVQMPQRAEIVDGPASPKNAFRFVDDSPSLAQVPEIKEPPAVAAQVPRIGVAQASRPISAESMKAEQVFPGASVDGRDSVQPGSQRTSDGLGIMDPALAKDNSLKAAEEYDDYANHIRVSSYDDDELHMPQAVPHSAGLGVPSQENRRLSVGLRPLPPDDFLESEDPEFRANRIRSFYKEYFEDGTAKTDAGKPPPIPHQPHQPQQAAYYEDYDNNYYGEATYFDPETNAFVMPYAQPVTRRAMTPPPSSRRPMPGPRQRGPHGSIGGMSAGPGGPPRGPGGPMGRPRAGSTMSSGRWAPMSPRPDSSASNPRYAQKSKKPLPPPVDLNTLPTPSKLKDDSFALSGALEFAPPPTIKDQAAGRSQSPVGERRPYALNTPVHSPLVSAFDETPALPSPFLLRKSGTFTALDFAPPRRFKDPEQMSDAGSIHSNRSGISTAQLSAIRGGAGRVSRLPGDTVFTQSAMTDTLKPSWNMRD